MALSRAFSGCDQPLTPFTHDELTSMAVAGKHYTFDSNNADELNEAIAAANASAEADGRATVVGEASETRRLPADAISHLDDVYRVVSVAKPALAVIAVLCVAGLAHVAVRINRRVLGRVLIAGGAFVLAAFAALGIWAVRRVPQPVFPSRNVDVFHRQPAYHPGSNRFLDGHGEHLACSNVRAVYTCCTCWFYVRT